MDCWLDPHCRSTVTPGTLSGQPGGQQGGAADVERLLAGLHHAAPDDVVDDLGVDAGALDQLVEDLRRQVGGVHAGQSAVALADR